MLPTTIIQLATSGPAGVFCRKQIYRRGFTDGAISGWIASGWMERVAPGWYRLSGAPVPDDQCLHLPMEYMRHKGGRRALLTGRAGLAVHGVSTIPLPMVPLVLIDRGYQVRVRNAPWVVSQTKLAEVESSRVRGLPVASPARCLADAALESIDGSPLSDEDLLQVFFDTVNRTGLSLPALIRDWDSWQKHRGANRLLDLADAGRLDVESHGEAWVLTRVFGDAPPAPDCQVVVAPGRRADFAFIFAGLIIEYYGEKAHEGRVDADATRAHELRSTGFDLYILTKSIVREDPRGAARSIHAIRRRREQLVLEGRIARPPLPPQPERRAPLRTAVPLG